MKGPRRRTGVEGDVAPVVIVRVDEFLHGLVSLEPGSRQYRRTYGDEIAREVRRIRRQTAVGPKRLQNRVERCRDFVGVRVQESGEGAQRVEQRGAEEDAADGPHGESGGLGRKKQGKLHPRRESCKRKLLLLGISTTRGLISRSVMAVGKDAVDVDVVELRLWSI